MVLLENTIFADGGFLLQITFETYIAFQQTVCFCCRYTTGDFKLSDGVEVVGVNTLIGKEIAATDKDVKNLLITHWEHKEIRHDQETTISYNRLNHLDFKYQIRIKNENQVQRKVFIRLWLGILMDKNGLK